MKNFIFRAAFRLGSIRSVFLRLREREHGAVGFLDLAADVVRLLRKSGRREHQGKADRPPPSRLVPLDYGFHGVSSYGRTAP
jgi:hypothetical protein